MSFQEINLRLCRRSRGFTLIELMIVVAVVAILSAIALPAYFDSIRKSRRSDAIAELTKVQQAQERWRSSNTTYNSTDVSSAATGLGVVGGTAVSTSYTAASGYYSIGIGTVAATGTTYAIVATALGSQTRDTNCQFLRVSMAAGTLVYASGPTSAVGNSAALNNTCWRR